MAYLPTSSTEVIVKVLSARLLRLNQIRLAVGTRVKKPADQGAARSVYVIDDAYVLLSQRGVI